MGERRHPGGTEYTRALLREGGHGMIFLTRLHETVPIRVLGMAPAGI
jgi:hypothetical protein